MIHNAKIDMKRSHHPFPNNIELVNWLQNEIGSKPWQKSTQYGRPLPRPRPPLPPGILPPPCMGYPPYGGYPMP
jgi:hypothetical protein